MARDKQLKDEPIEYQKQQYDEKNMVLGQFGERLSAVDLYEDIFDDLEMVMPIVIIDEEEQKHIVKMSIYEAIEHAEGRNDVLMGGTTYFNNFISKATAQNIHAFIIDMDNVYSGVLLRSLQHDWKLETDEEIPMPTYIVNSGLGLHLYFVLEHPLPCYRSQIAQIDQLYRRLAVMETTKRVYLRKSVQWFGQDFRMAGGNGKNGWENTVFRVGEKWNADKLAKAVGLENVHFLHEGEPRPKLKKEKHAKKRGQLRQGYYINPRVYESSVERCKSETHEGNRYLSMCALSVLAWKCNIPEETLEADLLSLIPIYNRNATKQIKKKEIYSAMKMYNPKAMETPKERSEDWLGWNFKVTKRNGRKQRDHVKVMNTMKALKKQLGEEVKEGRPNGSGTAEQTVREWQMLHPEGRKVDCIRETGLSKPTVYKWWKEWNHGKNGET